MRILKLLLVLVTFTCAPSTKASFVTPRSFDNVGSQLPGEGTTGFYGIYPGETRIYQYAASELAAQGLIPGDSITGVRARGAHFPNGPNSGPGSDLTWSNFTIQLAQATNSIANMGLTASGNMTNPVTVRSGPFTLPANSIPSGVQNTVFGYLMPFSTPYVYQGGDLVFYFARSEATEASGLSLDVPNSFAGDGTLYRTLLLDSNGANGSFNNIMTVLKFETQSVPEPTTTTLLLLGMLGCGWRRRR